MKNRSIRILLLEDDLGTVSLLAGILNGIERELQGKRLDVSLVVLSEYTMVQQYINQLDIHQYYIVLLDRDCKAGGSFHVLDLKKFDKNNVISISSMPQWNEAAQSKGVKRAVWKDYENLSLFANKVGDEIRAILCLPPAEDEPEDDPLLDEAIIIARKMGKLSANTLQRGLRVGYARAARLLDMLEERGIIGPAKGNNPRILL